MIERIHILDIRIKEVRNLFVLSHGQRIWVGVINQIRRFGVILMRFTPNREDVGRVLDEDLLEGSTLRF